jgi:hypothetical protein
VISTTLKKCPGNAGVTAAVGNPDDTQPTDRQVTA